MVDGFDFTMEINRIKREEDAYVNYSNSSNNEITDVEESVLFTNSSNETKRLTHFIVSKKDLPILLGDHKDCKVRRFKVTEDALHIVTESFHGWDSCPGDPLHIQRILPKRESE